ncbi:MAG TPA: thioesterase [Planctomycetaceae bacterium]|nr:acyl-CoA thioesterase [Pirellulales bacterium]HCP84065.1 thioesterase [Planctomycetaceae bacterium]
MITEHKMQFRVRYQETDAQGHVHHANYFTYFEMGRTELMRANDFRYRDMELNGLNLVIAEAKCEYFSGAQYEDDLMLVTRVSRVKGAAIEHEYEVWRDEELLVRGYTRLGCVDNAGKVRRIPSWLGGKGEYPDLPRISQGDIG